MTLYGPESAEPISKFTTCFESGGPVLGIEVTNGKTVSTTTPRMTQRAVSWKRNRMVKVS